jgi:hypothetical protein
MWPTVVNLGRILRDGAAASFAAAPVTTYIVTLAALVFLVSLLAILRTVTRLAKDRNRTRREVLRVVQSLHDPGRTNAAGTAWWRRIFGSTPK